MTPSRTRDVPRTDRTKIARRETYAKLKNASILLLVGDQPKSFHVQEKTKFSRWFEMRLSRCGAPLNVQISKIPDALRWSGIIAVQESKMTGRKRRRPIPCVQQKKCYCISNPSGLSARQLNDQIPSRTDRP